MRVWPEECGASLAVSGTSTARIYGSADAAAMIRSSTEEWVRKRA